MNKPTLVIMAAGMGSRFGGMKQVAAADSRGHAIIEYSIYDAMQAGFRKAVIVIKPEMEEEFQTRFGDRIAKHFPLEYAYQTLDALPKGFTLPETRKKPWGTGHAVLCAADKIPGDFSAINADDFYGRGAFAAAADFLSKPHADNAHAMVAYYIQNTLAENGYVSRGVCEKDTDGMLKEIIERVHIEPRPGGAAFIEDGHETFIPSGTPVSMNMWAFSHSILDALKTGFEDFLQNGLRTNPEKAEFYLPYIPNCLIHTGKASVKVLETGEKWYGMTYKEDLEKVRTALDGLYAAGLYPEKLFE